MSKTVEVPRIWTSKVPGSAVLEDFRLDRLMEQAGYAWAGENIERAEDRLASPNRWLLAEFRSGVRLHMKRALKSLRAGKDLPLKVTAAQASSYLRDEDLPLLNSLALQVVDCFVLDLAQGLGECAVMFSDPKQVSQKIQL